MGYREDTPGLFVLRIYRGTGQELLQLLHDMPQDSTCEIDLKHTEFDGCLVTLNFTLLCEKQWESPTYNWLLQLIKRLKEQRDPEEPTRLDAALFEGQGTDEAVIFGAIPWRTIATT